MNFQSFSLQLSFNETFKTKKSMKSGEIKTVTVFLFGQAHKSHWKLPLNKAVGLLNPKIMEDRQSSQSNKECF